MATTYELIASATAGVGGAAEFDLTSIPSTYDDLLVVLSSRTTAVATAQSMSNRMNINNSSSSITFRFLRANGGGVASGTNSGYVGNEIGSVPGTSVTANTFASTEIYLPNYSGSANKSYSLTNVTENNSSTNYNVWVQAGLRSNTEAINQLTFFPNSGNYAEGSSVHLYGITKA